jgi:hypothetical protein
MALSAPRGPVEPSQAPRRLRWLLVAGSALLAAGLARLAIEPVRALFAAGDLEVRPTGYLPPRPAATGALAPADPVDWRYFLDEPSATTLFALDGAERVYDPWTHFRRAGHLVQEKRWPEHPRGRWTLATNALGLRDDELADAPADVRVLVAGDSHTFGACDNHESFPALLEGLLAEALPGRSVEVLNAAADGYSFYNYLGTLLRFRDFEPQVFVVAVFAGNDFSEITFLEHWFGDTPQQTWDPEALARRDHWIARHPAVLGQCFTQLQMFRDHPHEIEPTLDCAADLVGEMQAVCELEKIELVVMLVPAPCSLVFPEPKPALERARAGLALAPADLALDETLERGFIARLAARGIRVLELRPLFAAERRPPYWQRDLHLDLAGHAIVARALLPMVRATFERD